MITKTAYDERLELVENNIRNVKKDLVCVGNHQYWLGRAKGYSEVNQEELAGVQRANWSRLLDQQIREHFGITPEERGNINILDIGAGPGFISIILTELGYKVTAADFAENMLKELKHNAGELASCIDIRQENAMALSFPDNIYDIVLSRNLTWNLPDPKLAYNEWLRVLKDDGLMLVFDANWYAYLRDEDVKIRYDMDRANVNAAGLDDYNVGENFDVMEGIADNMPLTGIQRPQWDEAYLSRQPIKQVSYIENIGEQVYSDKEKINYSSTPMFMVKVVK